MGSAWLCLLCLAGSGLVLPGIAEPVLGPRPAESLPGQSREETELVRGWGNGTTGSARAALGHLGVLLLPPPWCRGCFWLCWGVPVGFGGWFWVCQGVPEGCRGCFWLCRGVPGGFRGRFWLCWGVPGGCRVLFYLVSHPPAPSCPDGQLWLGCGGGRCCAGWEQAVGAGRGHRAAPHAPPRSCRSCRSPPSGTNPEPGMGGLGQRLHPGAQPVGTGAAWGGDRIQETLGSRGPRASGHPGGLGGMDLGALRLWGGLGLTDPEPWAHGGLGVTDLEALGPRGGSG